MVGRHAQQAAEAVQAAAARGVAAFAVRHDPAGGEAQYVARDTMAGAGAHGTTTTYEVSDAGDGAAAPRPGVVGNGVVVVGGRAQLPSDYASNAIYDGTSPRTLSSSTTAVIYEMGPESERQGGAMALLYHEMGACAANTTASDTITYAVPMEGTYASVHDAFRASSTGSAESSSTNTYDMQVPGMRSVPRATNAPAAAASTRPPATGPTAQLIYTSDDANSNYDKSGVPSQYAIPVSKDARPVPQAPTLPVRRATKRAQCERPAPTGGTCRTAPLPGGGRFCLSHACPVAGCGAGKSSSEGGCARHLDIVPTPRGAGAAAAAAAVRVLDLTGGGGGGGGGGGINRQTRGGSTYDGFDEGVGASSEEEKEEGGGSNGISRRRQQSTYAGFDSEDV